MAIALDGGQAAQDPVARAQRRIALLGDDQHPLAAVDAVFQRHGKQIPGRIGGQNLQHGDRRQDPRFLKAARLFLKRALVFHLAQDALEVDLGIALDAKGFGNIALGDKAGVLGDPLADLIFGRNGVHGLCLTRHDTQDHRPPFHLGENTPAGGIRG